MQKSRTEPNTTRTCADSTSKTCAAEGQPDDHTLRVECHCKLTSFSLSIPSSSLPLKSAVCHCNSCRHATGQLFATFAVLPVALPEGVLQDGRLVKYDSSPSCERWFCGRCGASVLNFDKSGGPGAEEWEICTGLVQFDSGIEGKLNRVQLWVEDVAGDGGAAVWINRGQLAGMDRHWRGRESNIVKDESLRDMMTGNTVDSADLLQAHCHCREATLAIAKPSQGSRCAPENKCEATLDFGGDTRLVSGFEVTSWVTVDQKQLLCLHLPAVDALPPVVKLGHYQTSSEGAEKSYYFCGRCGATILHRRRDYDSYTIMIGAGLLDTGTARKARVENWLRWSPYAGLEPGVESQGSTTDHTFVKHMMEGMRMAQRVL